MSWSTLLAHPPPDLELRFRTGTRRKSADGERLLVVHGAGVVTLETWRDEAHAMKEGRVSAEEAKALFSLLAQTGFPEVVSQTVPPGPGLVAIEVAGGPEHPPVLLHRSFVRDLPAWAALVARLDDVCARLA